MDDYARPVVEKFLKENGCESFGVVNGRAIWIKDEVIVIQIPSKGRIDYDNFESIATELIGIAFAEFDYWLGQNT